MSTANATTSSSGISKPSSSSASPTATASASATSASNNNNRSSRASCRSCVELVTAILQCPDSRPRQLLHSLMGLPATSSSGQQSQVQSLQSQQQQQSAVEQPSFQLDPVEDGVQIQMRVPERPPSLARRWTQITPFTDSSNDNSNNNNDNSQSSSISSGLLGGRIPLLATSAFSSANTANNSHNNPNQNNSDHENTSDGTDAAAGRPPVKFVTETIKIECRPCENTGPEQGARALIMGPTPLSIVACTNRITAGDAAEMNQILVHELVHAHDVQRLELDFADCESMAYSEVRAAREAECHPSSSSTTTSRHYVPAFLNHYCVRQKAIAATRNLFPTEGRNCVGKVFATAYNDPRPFHDHDPESNNTNTSSSSSSSSSLGRRFQQDLKSYVQKNP